MRLVHQFQGQKIKGQRHQAPLILTHTVHHIFRTARPIRTSNLVCWWRTMTCKVQQENKRYCQWNAGICHIYRNSVKNCFPTQNFTEIGQSPADLWAKTTFKRWTSAILNFEHVHILSPAVIEFQMCCCVPNFIKIGWFFVEIWRFNDLQYGGRRPSWICEI